MRVVQEGEFSAERIQALNGVGYNIYWLPNNPSKPVTGRAVAGIDIDQFDYVFVDMDLKSGVWTKETFTAALETSLVRPTFIVDSGGGLHAYWRVSDLDATSYLRLSRRLMRLFNTDEAVGQIYQLMRAPGTLNTKLEDNFRQCFVLEYEGPNYTCEQLDGLLPPIQIEDEEYCKQHYAKTYSVARRNVKINDKLPTKFGRLLSQSKEAKNIWQGNVDDRSTADMRLGHLMFANGFTKDEAVSVLVNCAKAISRAPVHRLSYAESIVDKIWTFENFDSRAQGETTASEESACDDDIFESVKDILEATPENQLRGKRFPCEEWIDKTATGFRLGQVIGLAAGSGVGKTAMSLNMFKGFVRLNPEYDHAFVTLEQPSAEIADRWKTMCGADKVLYDRVHIISNYAKDGTFRHLSLEDIKENIQAWEKKTNRKIGCVVIDHIGILRYDGKGDDKQRIINICHAMKAFAVTTNTLLVMQSQAPREKAGIGDIELNKDAAYGTVFFESYCDYLITIWQPLKRCYSNDACPTVMAFKFCKIRHKKRHLDEIQEDVNYRMFFDPVHETLNDMTQIQDKTFDFFLHQADKKRKAATSRDQVTSYQSTRWNEESHGNGEADSPEDGRRSKKADSVS